jgi:Ca2+:H+ antiporter
VKALWIMVPFGIAAGALDWPAELIFLFNLAAIVPVASSIASAIEDLSTHIGRISSGVLRAALGNPVELIIGIVALLQRQLPIVQSVLIGSILCHSLLILGASILFAGYDKNVLEFDRTVTNIMSSLMTVVSVSLTIPTFMSFTALPSDTTLSHDLLIVSHITAVILFGLFFVYLRFHLNTHASLFQDHPVAQPSTREDDRNAQDEGLSPHPSRDHVIASLALAISTLCLVLCASYLVGSIDRLALTMGVSKAFLGLVIIPAVGNLAKYIGIVAASRQQIDWSIRELIGGVLQITLLIFPVVVISGWMLAQPMTLDFDMFQTTVFFVAIMVMTYIIQDGRTNYFEGAVLMGTYIVIAVALYVRPDQEHAIAV